MTPDSAEQARESDTTRDADWKAHPLDIAVLISERDSLRAELSKAGPKWWDCATHGPATANAWGCPECVREMRGEIARLTAERDAAIAQAEAMRSRLSAILSHWREFGPEHGFDECVEMAARAAPTPEEKRNA